MGHRFWHPVLLILFHVILTSCLKKNSLTFAIDDTMSMQPVINAVRDASIKIMDLILKVSSSQIEDVVVVTFNDPDTKFLVRSRNRTDIIQALFSIRAHAGPWNTHCPEYAMSGVHLGLSNSLPGSTLFVFTDSDARDQFYAPSVIDLCQKMQSTVNFIITQSARCMPTFNYNQLKIYYSVAKACSGKVIYLNPAKLPEVFKLVDIFVQGEMTMIGTFDVPPNPWISRKQFSIDDQVEYVLVTVTGTTRELAVYHNGYPVNGKRVIWLQNVKAIQLNNPKAGDYLVEVHNHAHIEIKIEGRTDFTFEHGFSQRQPKTMNETTAQPIGDTYNYLSILVSDPSQAVSIKEVEIVNMDNEPIKRLPLKDLGHNYYISEPFMSPTQTFRIAVNGVVKTTGRDISRFAKVPVEPQPKPKVIPNKIPQIKIIEGDKIETKYGSSITLTCEVSAYPPPAIYWKDQSGKILSKEFSLKLQPYDYLSYLTLNNTRNSDQISCHAENGLLSTKKSISVNVKYFEVNSQLPALIEVKYGTSKTIKCDIQSQAPVRTRWYFQKDVSSSKVSLTTSPTYKISSNDKELTVMNMDRDQNGKYICEVSLCDNENKKETLHTQLKVVGFEVPVIQKNAQIYHTFASNSTTLSCITRGTPKPEVTWQWKPANSDWVKLSNVGEQLIIPNVELKHSGAYKCVAQNSEGRDHFDMTLFVNSPPIILSNKSEYIGVLGDSYLKIACKVIGYPTPTVTWLKGNEIITLGNNYTVYEGDLLLTNPQEMETNFTCEANNKFGKDVKIFDVSVYDYLKDYGETKYIYTKIGDIPSDEDKIFKCPLPYEDPKSIRWFTDGFSNNITGPILKIDKYEDSNHTCRVSEKNSSRSYTFILDIGTLPTFKVTDTIIEWTGSDETINCETEGKPEAQVEWYFNGSKIDESNKFVVIRPVITYGWGNYTCKATNVHGTVEKITTVMSKDCLLKRFLTTQNTPLFLKKHPPESTLSWPEYILGNEYFTIRSKETITFFCGADGDTSNNFKMFPSVNEIDAVCDNQDNFFINGSIYKTSDLTCNKDVKPTIIKTGEICQIEGIDKLKVGFKATNFIESYDVCFDSKRAIIHSVHVKGGTWGEEVDTSGYKWQELPGIGKRHDSEYYNCSAMVSSCCYAKSQLLGADVVSYSSSTSLSTYIENVNAVPEWRPCNSKINTWEAMKDRISNVIRDTDIIDETVIGASYTSKFGRVPKYLWQSLISKNEMKLALVYVNHPNPSDDDILCKKLCGDLYLDLFSVPLTNKSVFCCDPEEFYEKYSPKIPSGYID